MENERLLKIESGINFRELGGYTTPSGQTVKFHKVLRTASLGHLSANDLTYLDDYGVRYDIDFRSRDEQQQIPDRIPPHAEYLFDPIFGVDLTQASKFDKQDEANTPKQPDHDIEGMDEIPLNGYEKMLETYRDLINLDSAKTAYRRFFDKLLENEQDNQSVLFHCTAGKDRTGISSVFLLTALGVDRATIIQDYLLTNQTSKSFIDGQLQKAQASQVAPATLDSIRALLSVSTDYLQAADEAVQLQAGTWANYLRTELKVTPDQIHDLKRIYLI